MNKTEILMKEYFDNKKESKVLKEKRRLLHSDFATCEGENCLFDGTDEEDFCDFCKGIHKVSLKIKELGHKRAGILLKVRSIVNK